MSGGGGGGTGKETWRPSSSGGSSPKKPGEDDNDQCAFSEITILSSPDSSVVSTLTVGSILSVELQTDPIERVVATTNGQIAGSITSAKLIDIIECIRSGYSYSAVVKNIDGGRVDIEIAPT